MKRNRREGEIEGFRNQRRLSESGKGGARAQKH